MLIETLESRQFCSVSSVSPVSVAVAVDRLQIRVDLLRFTADALAGSAKITADLAALKAAGAKKDPTLSPLLDQFRTDAKAMHTQLRQDRLTQAQSVLTDQIAIVTTLKQIVADHGNADALAADRATLRQQRIQLQTDEVAGLTARINTRQSYFSTLSADLTALANAAKSSQTGTPALTAAVGRFTTDRTGLLTTLTADLQKLATDRTQLVTDLTALQNA